jgi:signal transduction histidine kinase
MMDIRIKGTMDGIDASNEIRRRYDIPVIFMTAHADETTIQRAKLTQPYGYLIKPFREHEVHASIETAIYRKKMERKLMESERYAVLGRLLGSVSHELNNPMQTIQNALFLLKGEKGVVGTIKDTLDIIANETRRMAYMLTLIRETHRPIESETPKKIDLNEMIKTIGTLAALYFENHSVEFKFEPDEAMPSISLLPNQIRQVLLNLMMNSVDAMYGGGTLTVRTEFIRDNNQVLIQVSDTGTGVPDSLLGNLFEPFASDKVTSTGLGLAISKNIVLKHNGQITAQNNPGGGATFKIVLPINP